RDEREPGPHDGVRVAHGRGRGSLREGVGSRLALPSLREELIAMAGEDRRVRDELLRAGELPADVYAERMAEVHRRNNARMPAILREHGWPGRSRVGDDGAEAAWLIVQHAVLAPAVQRRGLALLRRAVATGEAPAWQLAYLEDRVR